MRISLIMLAVPALLLAGCNSEPEPVAAKDASDDRTAAGDVQGGTISDAMLPLESVRSQSPPLAPAPSERATSSRSPAPASDGDDNVQAEAEPEPSSAPPPEPAAEETAE